MRGKPSDRSSRLYRLGQFQICLSVTLDERLNDRLIIHCEKEGLSKTAVIREALEKHLPDVRQVKKGVD